MPNSQLATSNNILSLQKQISQSQETERNFLVTMVLSIFQFIWRELAIAFKNLNRRKKYELIIGIWGMNGSHLRKCSAKIDILQNSCLTEYQTNCMIKIFEKNEWRSLILVKWKASIICNFSKNRTLAQDSYFTEYIPVTVS